MVRGTILHKMGVIVYFILVFNTQMKTRMGREERREASHAGVENSPHSGLIILQR